MLIREATHPPGYEDFLRQLKDRIRSAQVRAALAVNHELVALYWQTGRDILTRQQQQGWGAQVVNRLAGDLRRAFPEMKGFSPRNLKYMRAFAEAYPEAAFVQQVVAQIPWGHNVRILDYVKNPAARKWYVRQTIQYGWSRNVLVNQIESGLYYRQGQGLDVKTNLKPQLSAAICLSIALTGCGPRGTKSAASAGRCATSATPPTTCRMTIPTVPTSPKKFKTI